MSEVTREHLASCASTQDEVRTRLAAAAAGATVAVSCDEQGAGRGREQRSWQTPPGAGVLLSVGRRGPLAVSMLEELPRRVADAVLDAVSLDGRLTWKAPNDLVAAADGAKVAGILVDARTVGTTVEEVIVGIGINAAGEAFTTADGRCATTLEQLAGRPIDVITLRDAVIARIASLLA